MNPNDSQLLNQVNAALGEADNALLAIEGPARGDASRLAEELRALAGRVDQLRLIPG